MLYTFEIRPGVELEIDVSVAINHAPRLRESMEMLEIIEHRQRQADETIARYTREYLQAHVKKAFDSLEPLKTKAC